MTDANAKIVFANFPERTFKVMVGANISATVTKTIRRMTIGTYEMSTGQQENSTKSREAARQGLITLAKANGLSVARVESKEFIGVFAATGGEADYTVWVTTPIEPTQAAHIIWAKYVEIAGEGKVGIAYKVANAFTSDDVLAVLRTALKNAVVLGAGEPFTLKGNPPPRFQKKVAPAPAEAT